MRIQTALKELKSRAFIALTGSWLLASGFLLLLTTGCEQDKAHRSASHAVEDYRHGNFGAAEAKLEKVAQETNENFVLNNCRLGSAALADYNLDSAEAAFLRAYEVINSVGVNQGGRSLGAALVDEKIKIWKGEPYERAMANFYLGLIYYMRHDYDNARASFENALFKLRDYSDKEDKKEDYRAQESNFVLATLMLAKSWQRLGRDDMAASEFERCVGLRSDLRVLADPSRNAQSNLLLVLDFGYGPTKVTDADGSIVGFAPPPERAGIIPHPQVILDGKPTGDPAAFEPTIDLLAMAQDRRWQDIDTIRAIKSTLGTASLIGGGIMGAKGLSEEGSAQRRDLAIAGGLALAGLALKASSQADVRQWEMLPRTVFVLPLRVEPGMHDVIVDFPNVPGLRQEWRDIRVPDKGDATYYMRIEPWHNGPFQWPPPAMAGAQ
jgi:tetratricopeptide (TPR) repeat protein